MSYDIDFLKKRKQELVLIDRSLVKEKVSIDEHRNRIVRELSAIELLLELHAEGV